MNQPWRRDSNETASGKPGAVHEWLAIDSCSRAGVCAPLSYLEQLRIDVSTAVKTIIISHWHDDHIKGLAQLYTRPAAAGLVYPAAFQDELFQALIAAYPDCDPSRFYAWTSEPPTVLNHF